jgi:Kelch motif
MCSALKRLLFAFAAGLIIAPFGAVAQSPRPAGSWTQKAPMPAVRGEVAAAVVDNKLFALGGGEGGKAVPRNEEYDPASDRWREHAPLPQARDHLGVATHGGKIYTFGGFTSSVHQGAGDVVFAYDPATDLWQTLRSMKAARAAVGVAVLAGKIHVIGGRGLDGATVATHEVTTRRAQPGARPRHCRARATIWRLLRSMEGSTSSAGGWRVPPSVPASTISTIRRRIRGVRRRRCQRRVVASPLRCTGE